MCIAKIYCNNKNFETLDLIDVLPFSEYIEDTTTPTLLIGKNNSEETIGKEKIKVLNKEINKNLFWTYSKVEKRSEFEKDVLGFYQNIFKTILKTVTYRNIDLYNTTYQEIKQVLNMLYNGEDLYTYITDKHLYIYDGNEVVGISLDEAEFIGVNKEKIKDKLKKNKNNKLIFNDFFIKNNVKKYLNDNKFVIPYLYSLKNQ